MSARSRPEDLADIDALADQEFSQVRQPAVVNQDRPAPSLAPVAKPAVTTPEAFFFPVEDPKPRLRR